MIQLYNNQDGTAPRKLLKEARQRFTQREIANHLDVEPRTVSRWETGQTHPPTYILPALRELMSPPSNDPVGNGDFSFIDLFAGIGGCRMGFERHGGKCIFTSEWDEACQKTYRANFAVDHPLMGDVTKLTGEEIPDHDVLVAGFPCQPFSIAGVSKKNALGLPHGFKCKTQGTLFFELERIIKKKRPWAFMLENVKHLLRHDGGRTFEVIRSTLEDELGYELHHRVIDAGHYVPQHRERIIIVGFREKTNFSWDSLKLPDVSQIRPTMKDILHPEDGTEEAESPYTMGKKARVAKKYVLTDHLWQYLQDYAAKHRALGNGFGYGLVGPDDIARTLSARYYKDGAEILVSRGKGNPRRITPREASRLMGFDTKERKFKISVSDTRAYRQFGNAVVVPVIAEVARIMKSHVLALKASASSGPRQILLKV